LAAWLLVSVGFITALLGAACCDAASAPGTPLPASTTTAAAAATAPRTRVDDKEIRNADDRVIPGNLTRQVLEHCVSARFQLQVVALAWNASGI
jgi:hypothetical protein